MITKQEALAITTYEEFDRRRDEFKGFECDKETRDHLWSLFPEPSGYKGELYRTHPYEQCTSGCTNWGGYDGCGLYPEVFDKLPIQSDDMSCPYRKEKKEIRKLVKAIMCDNGDLYGTVNGQRILLAKCRPKIEILELESIKNDYETYILCGVPEFTIKPGCDFLDEYTIFGLETDIQHTDGIFERIYIDDIIPLGINPDGEWVFASFFQPGLTKKLLSI